ncbi:hypothetical protein K438DRAFT_1759811 [Mycena galopus ATCC 62051]|nr:hypothetical protein K438DRAFT_1759811 [Mycena galopus ATCC 62051]
MPSNRARLPHAKPGRVTFSIDAMVYPAAADPTAVPVVVLLVDDRPTHYPFVENAMQGVTTKGGCVLGHVHDVPVSVWHRNPPDDLNGDFELSRFHIFFKRHRQLPVNWRVDPDRQLRGDVVVMRAAPISEDFMSRNVVDVRDSDRPLIDFAIESLLPSLQAFQNYQTPIPYLIVDYDMRMRMPGSPSVDYDMPEFADA